MLDWNQRFAQRTRLVKRGAVRELLKLTARPDVISFAGGLPAAELFPVARVQEALGRVLRRVGSASLQYSETEGLPELRDWLARCCSRPGFTVRRENVLITSGAQQALDLVGRVLLEPGDQVIVENPTYLALLSAWRPLGVRFRPIPADAEGLQIEPFADLVRREHPKLVYLVPNFQNPQGTTLAPSRRERLATLLRESGAALVEDNPYGQLRYDGTPLPDLFELTAADGPEGLTSPVIQTGTFSKVLMPGLRVGWVMAAQAVIEKLVQAKQAADLHTSTLCQHLVFELVSSGFLEEFVPVLCQTYRQRRDQMLASLAQCFHDGTSWTRPEGGMFLLATLRAGRDAGTLLPQALARGVAFVPGEEFHLEGSGRNTLRLNFSNASPERIAAGVERLAEVVDATK